MINLFIVVYNFSGAKTYVDELSLFFACQKDVAVFQVFLNCVGYKEFFAENNDRAMHIYIPEKITGKYDKIYYRRAAQLVFSHFHDLRNVVLHANMPEQFYFAEEMIKLFQCPLVFTCHFLMGFYSCYDTISGYNGENKVHGNVLEEFMIGLADQIICVTEFGRRALVNVHKVDPAKTRVIFNGKSFSALAEGSKMIKSKYGFSADDRLILFAGQLDPMKGIYKLIEAFLLIKDTFPTAKLVVAGQGEYSKYLSLARQCIGRVCFTGHLDKETLNDFYRFSEVGVIPSQYEQCSYVAIEMMQNKLPLIISNIPGLNELITHKKTGLVCKTKPHCSVQNVLEVDETDLALQIEYLLMNPAEAAEYAEQAYKQVLRAHSLEDMGEATLNIYRKLLNEKDGTLNINQVKREVLMKK